MAVVEFLATAEAGMAVLEATETVVAAMVVEAADAVEEAASVESRASFEAEPSLGAALAVQAAVMEAVVEVGCKCDSYAAQPPEWTPAFFIPGRCPYDSLFWGIRLYAYNSNTL